MDTMVTDHMDIMDTTDHIDTEDTMVRDLLMKLQLQDQMLMLRPMLMLGMDTMVTDLGDTLDTTDHTDTGVTMVRDLLMRLPPPLDLTQMLKLILTTDMAMATTDHTDTTEDTMARDPLMTKLLLDQMLILRLMLMLGMD